MTHSTGEPVTDTASFWEAHYVTNRGESGYVWSGQVNAAVEQEVAGLKPGAALELGCGEGGDALWLASQGWTVTAVDVSANALGIGSTKAAQAGLEGKIHWVQADLATWRAPNEFDLVTAAFLHSPVELPREEILRRAVSAVAPDGRLLIVGHGGFPPGSPHGEHDHGGTPFPTPDEVLADLELPAGWVVETNALVERPVAWRDGTTVTLVDAVLRVRREA